MSVKICHEAFFCEKITNSHPMLEGIGEVFKRDGLEAAEAMFARFIRESGTLRVDYYFPDPPVAPTEEALAEGERILDGWLSSVGVPMHFPDRKVDWTANPTFNKYCEWTWQLARHPEWSKLGALYRATGDEKYTK